MLVSTTSVGYKHKYKSLNDAHNKTVMKYVLFELIR